MINCLLVDDDVEIRALVGEFLGRFDMAVTAVADGASLREQFDAGRFDIVLLDLMLPDEDGLKLCQWVRANSAIPVIMLTARGDPLSRILGLEIGADDYLGKPFEPRELVARIHAVLRRTHAGRDPLERRDSNMIHFDGWTFDRVRRQLISSDKVLIALSSAEFRLLAALVERPGRVLSREILLDAISVSGLDCSDRSIDLAISRLRQKLGDPARDPRLIRTVRGEGYLFDPEVTR
jgi:two-component system, OmpR family, response regulator